jgi:hypothetical protein
MKERTVNALVWLGIFLTGALLATALAFPAWAQEVGRGLVCDTAQQAEIYVAHVESSDSQAALQEVNRDSPTACAIVVVAYLRGEEVKTVNVKHGTVRIVAITLVGVMRHGQLVAIPPWQQFTLFLEKNEGV